jgi:hypothetical protein
MAGSGQKAIFQGRSGRVRSPAEEATTSRLGGDFGLARATRSTLGLDKVHRQNSRQSLDAAQSPENSMFEYQTTESYAPLGPMSGAKYVSTAGLIHLCKITEPVAGEQFGGTSKLFSQSRSAFARTRSFRLLLEGQNDIVRSDCTVGQLEPFGL